MKTPNGFSRDKNRTQILGGRDSIRSQRTTTDSKIPKPIFASERASIMKSYDSRNEQDENCIPTLRGSKVEKYKKYGSLMNSNSKQSQKKFKMPESFKDESVNSEAQFNCTMSAADLRRAIKIDDSPLQNVTNEISIDLIPTEHYAGETPKRLSKRMSQDENLYTSRSSKGTLMAKTSKNNSIFSKVKKDQVASGKKPSALNNHNKTNSTGKANTLRNSVHDYIDNQTLAAKFENVDDIQKKLYVEMMDNLKQNAELELQEKHMREQYRYQKQQLERELEDAEKELVDAMRLYVDVEDQVWEVESHDINVHHQVYELTSEYEEIIAQIKREKISDPKTIAKMYDLDNEYEEKDLEYQSILAKRDFKKHQLRENLSEIEKEFNHALEVQLNIQLLSEKPYTTAICFNPSQAPCEEPSKAHYFSSVENKFTSLKLSSKTFKFNKILQNSEIAYFKPPFKASDASDLPAYLTSTLLNLAKFIRRIYEPCKSTFQKKSGSKVNSMNRKLTVILVDLAKDVLQQVLLGIEQVLGEPEDVQLMITTLLGDDDTRLVLHNFDSYDI